MKGSEATELGRVVGDALKGTARRTGQASAAVIDLGYRAARRMTRPSKRARVDRVRAAHLNATERAARKIGTGLQAMGRTAGRVGSRLVDGRPVVEEHAAHQWVSVLNGVYGDRLNERRSPLSLPMSLRADGRDVPATADGMRAAYPAATGLVVVFVHGLVETDAWWDIRSERNWRRPGESYSGKLRAGGTWTPVQVRYNTGLRVSDNGRRLDALLEGLVAGWPVPVRSLVLVGHSMGGLVLHSALAQAGPSSGWSALVRVTVTLGTPHQGAALVRGVARLSPALAKVPETRWLAEVIASRPPGIGDLGHGNLLADDWRDLDPASLTAVAGVVPLATGVRHCVVIGTVPSKRDGLLADWVGDLLVRPGDARPATQRGSVEDKDVRVVGGASHLDLLNHPAVYLHLTDWLAYAARQSADG
ncbi:MAG: hypothetical protein WAR57_14835 [Candidatus Phosphoribacter sp.]|nr:hypothetical protein [Actinomycetales bacterium]